MLVKKGKLKKNIIYGYKKQTYSHDRKNKNPTSVYEPVKKKNF